MGPRVCATEGAMPSVFAAPSPPRFTLRARHAAALACLVAAGLTALSPSARGDWPMARHDPQRSGAASGTSNIQTPTVAWSAYLGGGLGPQGLLTGSINGQNAFIRASGGSVAAVLPDGTVLWKVATHGATTLLGLADLAGDGKQEVIAYTNLDTWAIDLATGAVSWVQPPGEMGLIGSVRMADVNGDGLPDLVIGEGRSGVGAKMQTGFIYSFKGGFEAPLRITLPYPSTGLSGESTLADMDGKGGAELILQGTTAGILAMVDGTTGEVVATSPDLALGTSYVGGCVPANLGAGPAQEVVCVASAGAAPMPGAGDSSKVFAVTLAAGSPPTLSVAWSVSLEPTEAISVSANNLVVNLAGDGQLETVISGGDASGASTVHILSAATGAERASIPGELFLGTTPALPSGGRLIATQGTSGISLWAFDAAGVHAHGVIDDKYILQSIDWTRVAISSAQSLRPITLDVADDGATDVLTIDATLEQIRAWTPGAGQPSLVGSVSFPANTPYTGAWPLPAMDRSYPQLGVVASDGHLRLLDKTLSFTSTDVPVGGYYISGGYLGLGSSPVVGSLDSGPAQVLVTDSRGVLVRLDASAATASQAPVDVWEQPSSTSPVIAAGLDGSAAGVFTLHVVDPSAATLQFTVRRLNAAGAVVWEIPISGTPREDILAAHFSAGTVPDVAIQSGASLSSTLITYAFSGADGHALWSSSQVGCALAVGMSIVDWNGDGIDDVVHQSGGTFVSSGVDGSLLASGGPSDCYALPVPFDSPPELVYTAADPSTRIYAHDLGTQVFASTDTDQPFPYGAIAACPSGNVLIEGSSTYPSRLKLTALDGATPGSDTTVFLASGALYAADPTGSVATGQLTAVNVHDDLTGNGKPMAVVGSGDGWLYAIDPCAGTLTFAYDFGASVGEPVFGDTDGDGFDEIVVSVADGYLYALKNTPPATGTGGGGTGGGGTGGGRPGPILLYGRAGCECGMGATSTGYPALLAFAVAWLAAVARRERRR